MSWRLARAAAQLKAECEQRWPDVTVWTIGDAEHRDRPSDHNPWGPEGIVTAIDVVGTARAAELWRFLHDTRDPRIEYAIFDGELSGSDTGWRPTNYTGSNQHTNHVHVSFGRGSDGKPTRPDLYDDDSPFGFAGNDPSTSEEDTMPRLVRHGDGRTVYQLVAQTLHKIEKPEVAALLAGDDWRDKVVSLNDQQWSMLEDPDGGGSSSHDHPDGTVSEREVRSMLKGHANNPDAHHD